MVRVVVGAIVCGIVVFVWGFVSHMVLPIGEMGMNAEMLPGETALLESVKTTIPDSGIYFMPGLDTSIADTQAQWEDSMKRAEMGPVAFLVVQKDGSAMGFPMQLGLEFISNILAALVAALVLTGISCKYGCRVLVVMGLGFFAWLSVDVSQWIWYGFSLEYIGAQAIDHLLAWLLAGLILAAIVKPCRNCATAQEPEV